MRVAIYARVSTESQEARGTIGSQLEILRKRTAAEGQELVAEFCDDGCSGSRLDRPGLDALRDAAEAGQLDAVWCLSPDRLARMYAYQIIVLDELARHGVKVLFHDTPALADDPQTQLLTQVQGVISEYERAKNRRAKFTRQGVACSCRRGGRLEMRVWLSTHCALRQPTRAPGGLRAGGDDRTTHFSRLRREQSVDATNQPTAQSGSCSFAKREGRLGSVGDRALDPQRDLCRSGTL